MPMPRPRKIPKITLPSCYCEKIGICSFITLYYISLSLGIGISLLLSRSKPSLESRAKFLLAVFRILLVKSKHLGRVE